MTTLLKNFKSVWHDVGLQAKVAYYVPLSTLKRSIIQLNLNPTHQDLRANQT